MIGLIDRAVDQGIFPSNYVRDTLSIAIVSRSDYSPYRSRMSKLQCCTSTTEGMNDIAIGVLISLIQTEKMEDLAVRCNLGAINNSFPRGSV